MIIRTDRGVTLIGGGAVDAADVALARGIAPVVVAADGGADAALDLGLMPEAVIGDFDSISAAARAAIPQARQHPVAEQDSTDFAKCLRRIDAPFVLAVGFTGPRMDHALAALTVLCHDPRPVVLIGGEDLIFRAPKELALAVPKDTRVSLWPMGVVRGRSVGLNWPIDGIEMTPSGRVGTSNRAVGPVALSMTGDVLVILPKAMLAVALDGLGLRAR
ncbi:thiamine diphosphokinase [Paracoccus sp. p4-l81]|uniref:thiamine diphosphokinase n=1 Tax=unclassified Paracoccus (in: a-proteobacteria) TaxID=2688777 RepID=UPI0035B7BC8C